MSDDESGMEDLYTRAWCLVEYIYAAWLRSVLVQTRERQMSSRSSMSEAKKFGFYKDKVLITGPNDFSEPWPAHARDLWTNMRERERDHEELDDVCFVGDEHVQSFHDFPSPSPSPKTARFPTRIPKRPAHRSGPALRHHQLSGFLGGSSKKRWGNPMGKLPVTRGILREQMYFLGPSAKSRKSQGNEEDRLKIFKLLGAGCRMRVLDWLKLPRWC